MTTNLFVILFVVLFGSALGGPQRSSRVEENVFLRLFTRQNPTVHQLLTVGDQDVLLQSNFNLSNPLKFFAHGRLSPWENPELVEAFLSIEDVNVILIDWTLLSNFTDAKSEMVEKARYTGQYVASFIDWLSTLGLSFSDVHVIGFSIGAHAAAFSARYCENGVVEYVTGLDPARSTFELGVDHINANDGKYVEVIHTSYGGGNSFYDPIGTADFYPNGGATQPGCSSDLCNHMRAIDLFVESVVSEGFVSKKCNNFEETVNNTCADIGRALMGRTGSAKDITGVYYLNTNADSPFAQGNID